MNNLTQTELNTYIEEQLVLPNIQKEVESLIKYKRIWHYVSIISEFLSQIFSAVATVLSFSASFYKLELLSFLSGIINILSLLLLLFSKYSNEKGTKCLEQLQKIPIFSIIRPSTVNDHSSRII